MYALKVFDELPRHRHFAEDATLAALQGLEDYCAIPEVYTFWREGENLGDTRTGER
jgi:hypothetical protein